MLCLNASTAYSIHNSKEQPNSSKFHILLFLLPKQKGNKELNISSFYEDIAACVTNAPCWKLHEVIPIALIKSRYRHILLHAE